MVVETLIESSAHLVWNILEEGEERGARPLPRQIRGLYVVETEYVILCLKAIVQALVTHF
jgi:hypothetical protein